LDSRTRGVWDHASGGKVPRLPHPQLIGMRTLASSEADSATAGWGATASDVASVEGQVRGSIGLDRPTSEALPRGQSKRDSRFRRALGIADAAALLLSLGTVVLIAGGHLGVGAFVACPILVLLAKAVGLYDRDEHLLHKT